MTASRPERTLLVIVVALVIAAVAVLVLSTGRRVATYEIDTPEGVAQAYLDAAFDGDFDRAVSFFEPDSDCDASDLDRAFIQENARIGLIDVVTETERSRVRVSVEVPSGGPLGGYYREEHTLRLIRANDAWLLTGIPWPLYDCAPPRG